MIYLTAIFFLVSLLNETLPKGPVAYVGKGPREIILLDPDNSPLLKQAVDSFIMQLPKHIPEEEIINELVHYIAYELFDPSLCNEDFVFSFISEKKEMPLEAFIEAKAGICRHIALTTVYFLEKCVEKDVLDGKAFLIREDIPSGRHGWALFLTKNSAWHIDAYWGFAIDGKNSSGFKRLCQKYGKRVMDKQKTRWNQ